ncbi:hypothetical protein Tco_0418328 [Tanacetum coccineum]
MSNLVKLEFLALDISGQNYLSWVLDAEIYLAANVLGDTIKAGKETTIEQKVKAMIFLRHHLHENLKIEYLTVKDPLVLWNHLKDIYEHQKIVILLRARYEWVHLRFQDFKTVAVVDQTVDEDAAVDVVVVVASGVDLAKARACRTPKHLLELYQRSQKSKGKGVEVNLAYQNKKIDNFDIDNFGIDSLGVPKDQNDTTHLDVSDFSQNVVIHNTDIRMGKMSSMKFGMNYDNTNGDPHVNEYELEVQGTIYIQDLKSGDIVIQKVRSSDNLSDLFTKALSTATFKKLVHGIGM